MTDIARNEEIDLLREELEDLDRQVADGDLDAATAARLADRYRAELDELEAAAIEDADATADIPTGDDEADPSGATRTGARRISGRTLAGIAIVGVAIVAITVFAVSSLDRSGSAGAEGIVGDVLADDGQVDLSTISNEEMEAVVEQNPEVIGMRLALARRYFEGGQFDRALDHYFEVLEREDHPEALSNIGWMTYLSERPDVAVGYLEAALQRQPDYLPAQWFIANVYVTLGRNDEAAVYLTTLLEADGVPEQIVENARTLLAQIGGSP
jgi:tetratricopeptide (TPR) repeat protein